MNYYNEIDPGAAAWLRELIGAQLIPDGHVDTRSICDVQPGDLTGYTQCHFFAGIGGWSHALQLAGWPTDVPVWTGSCPCQPFSISGRQRGESDERHLWPELRRLVAECRPSTVIGEQVASPLGREWLSGVRSDVEALGYAVGAADLCAAGVGAPHIRQRLYWVAHSGLLGQQHATQQERRCNDAGCGKSLHFRSNFDIIPCRDGKSRRIESQSQSVDHGLSALVVALRAAGFSEAEIEVAQDSFPLAHWPMGRVMLLRGYGNAIVPQVAAEFIQSFMETQ